MAVANTLAYYITATIMAVKSFIVQAPGVDLTKLFRHKFPNTFCKLDHFKNISKFVAFLQKDLAYKEREREREREREGESKFMPKKVL